MTNIVHHPAGDHRSVESRSVTSDTSGSSRVSVEQVYPQNEEEDTYLLPKNASSIASEQCCTACAYSIDLRHNAIAQSAEVEVSAFLRSGGDSDASRVLRLSCNPDFKGRGKNKAFFKMEYKDEILKVKILPLPINTTLQTQQVCPSFTASQALGVLVVVVTKSSGMHVHSLVLLRNSSMDPFHLVEFKKVSRGAIENDTERVGRRLEICASFDCLDNQMYAAESSNPILYVALSSGRSAARSARVDVLACPMVGHKCPLFQFANSAPTRALKRTLVLSGVSSAKGVALCVLPVSGVPRCTVAALFEQELKIVGLPSLEAWNTQALKPEDIVSVPIQGNKPSHSLGSPFLVTPMISTKGSDGSVVGRFAVLCGSRKHDISANDEYKEQRAPLASPMSFNVSPATVMSDKEEPPPAWTTEETRNAVRRARRDILSNLSEAMQPIDQNNNPLYGRLDDDVVQTPCAKERPIRYDGIDPGQSLDVSIPSPATAVLDMSGRWMSSVPSDSMTSPLTGLTFLDENSCYTGVVTPSINRVTPPPVSNFATPRPDADDSEGTNQLSSNAHLVVVSVGHDIGDQGSPSTSTQVFPVPAELAHTEVLCMKSSAGKGRAPSESAEVLWVAMKPLAKSEVQMMRFPLLGAGESPTRSHGMLVNLNCMGEYGKESSVKSLDIVEHMEGEMSLRIVVAQGQTSAKWDDRLIEPSSNHGEQFDKCQLSVTTVDAPMETANQTMGRDWHMNNAVADKFDRILAALGQFEARVDERLNRMERTIANNSERIAELEEQFSSRAEI